MKRDLILRPMCKCDRRRFSCMISTHVSPWYANSMTKETCMYEKRPINIYIYIYIYICIYIYRYIYIDIDKYIYQ